MNTEISNEQGAVLFQLHENTPSRLFWIESEYLSPCIEWYQQDLPGMRSVSLKFENHEQRAEFLTELEYEGYVPQSSILGFTFTHNPYHIPARVWEKVMGDVQKETPKKTSTNTIPFNTLLWQDQQFRASVADYMIACFDRRQPTYLPENLRPNNPHLQIIDEANEDFGLDLYMLYAEDMYHHFQTPLWARIADTATRAVVGAEWLTCNHR